MIAMKCQLSKTIRFIFGAGEKYVSYGLPCHSQSLSIHPSNPMLVVSGKKKNVFRKRSPRELFSPVLDDLFDRMPSTCRHCACSRDIGTLSIFRPRRNTL
jgi:hypothetical protein